MIRAIALDDEPLALSLLENFAERSGRVRLAGSFTAPDAALRFAREHRPVLAFLDVCMPDRSGTDLAAELPEGTLVIFTTAHSEHAAKGFELDAVDYLLKPFAYERFLKALEKAESRIAAAPRSFYVKADQGTLRIPTEEVLYLEGIDNYVKIYLERGKPVLVRSSLKEMLARLEGSGFLRVHRSYIVPADRILAFRKGQLDLGFREFPVGGTYLKEVQQFFEELRR